MIKIVTILCTIVIMATASVKPSLPPLKWKKPFSELASLPDVMIELSDSTMICGSTIIENGSGRIIDSMLSFDIRNHSRTFNGGFVVAEGEKITVLDAMMEQAWSKVFGKGPFISVVQTKYGGYAALTKNREIILTDMNGIEERTVQINTTVEYPPDSVMHEKTEATCYPEGIARLDNGVIIYGRSMISSSVDCWIFKYGTDGTEQWRTLLGGVTPGEIVSMNESIMLSGDIDYRGWQVFKKDSASPALGKRCYFPDSKVPLIEIDSEGTILLHEDYFSTTYSFGQSLAVNNSTCFIGYYSYEPPVSDNNLSLASIIAVTRSGGKVLWSQEYHNTELSTSEAHKRPLRAQSLHAGIMIAAFDTLYFHEHPSEFVYPRKQPVQVSDNIRTPYLKDDNFHYTLEMSVAELSISFLSPNGRLLGRTMLYNQPAGNHFIPIRHLTRGICIVRLFTGSKEYISRQIIR